MDDFSEIMGKQDIDSTMQGTWKEIEAKTVEFVKRENKAKVMKLVEVFEETHSQAEGTHVILIIYNYINKVKHSHIH